MNASTKFSNIQISEKSEKSENRGLNYVTFLFSEA